MRRPPFTRKPLDSENEKEAPVGNADPKSPFEELMDNPEDFAKKVTGIAEAIGSAAKDSGLFPAPRKLNRKITLNVEFTVKDE